MKIIAQKSSVNLPLKPTEEEMCDLNNPIPKNEIKFVVKHLPAKKVISIQTMRPVLSCYQDQTKIVKERKV